MSILLILLKIKLLSWKPYSCSRWRNRPFRSSSKTFSACFVWDLIFK